MAKRLKRGDEVTWNSPQGKVRGKVEKRLIRLMRIKGHTFKASPENPEYLVRSAKTGARAAHKPRALKKS